MPHQPVQPLGPPGEAFGNRRLQPFREYPTCAFPLRAQETPHFHADHDVTTVRRQVGQSPSIPTANHPRYHAARGTGRAGHARAGENPDRLGRPLNPIHHQTGRSHFPPASIRSHRSSPLHDLGQKTNQARKRKMCIEIDSEPKPDAYQQRDGGRHRLAKVCPATLGHCNRHPTSIRWRGRTWLTGPRTPP